MSDKILKDIHTLIAAAKAALAPRAQAAKDAKDNDDFGREAARVLAMLEPLPPQVDDFPESAFPVVASIAEAAEAAKASEATQRGVLSPLLLALVPTVRHLPWKYTYADRADAPDLRQKIAFAEIIGPEAPLRSDEVCLGFTWIAPETLYPMHYHPAIELYHVVSGVAIWTLEGKSHRHAPGAFILHPSNAQHAMQTGTDPLLALYTWSGEDVRTTSAYEDKR
jgi:quercetin dioxygenase-like cupin family protein